MSRLLAFHSLVEVYSKEHLNTVGEKQKSVKLKGYQSYM